MGLKETIKNDAYANSCACPTCNKVMFRGSKESTFYCRNCGEHLHARAFTKEEIDDAIFQKRQDEYED